MWSSGSTSSDLAKGKKFLNQLLYVQHVDKEKDTTCAIPELSLLEHLQCGRKMSSFLHDGSFGILKSSLKYDIIVEASVYSNPLPIPLASLSDVTIHAFVVLKTENRRDSKNTWWSLEKNGRYIVLQQSPDKEDVTEKIYDAENEQHVKRLEPVKQLESTTGNYRPLEKLIRAICETNQLCDPYHLLYSNCQNFASFVFAKSNKEGKTWSAPTSARFGGMGLKNKKIQPGIEADAVKYNSITKDEKFDFYRAMIERRKKAFGELVNDLTSETLNSIDSQGYTLLEWATVFSTPDWPIDEELKEKGAVITADEESFRQNVFFIALQYLPCDQEFKSNSTKLLSLNGIAINGVNKAGDTALHLAMYGEKWEIAEEILNRLEDYEVNVTNSMGDTLLHLAAKLKCGIGLFKNILDRINSENINKADGNGCTALHWVVRSRSTEKMKLLLDKRIEINAQDNEGNTALHIAIMKESETAVKQLLNKHEKVDVNVQNNGKSTALHLACKWRNIPADSFKKILEKSNNINAQDNKGNTALHYVISANCKAAVEELLERKNQGVVNSNSHGFLRVNGKIGKFGKKG